MNGSEMVTVKEYIESRMKDTARLFETKVDALDKATLLAAQQMEKRLEGMNEFRDALRDQNTTFIRKQEYDIKHDAMVSEFNSRISALELSKAELSGKANQSSVNMITIFSVISILISLSSLLGMLVHYFGK